MEEKEREFIYKQLQHLKEQDQYKNKQIEQLQITVSGQLKLIQKLTENFGNLLDVITPKNNAKDMSAHKRDAEMEKKIKFMNNLMKQQ